MYTKSLYNIKKNHQKMLKTLSAFNATCQHRPLRERSVVSFLKHTFDLCIVPNDGYCIVVESSWEGITFTFQLSSKLFMNSVCLSIDRLPIRALALINIFRLL